MVRFNREVFILCTVNKIKKRFQLVFSPHEENHARNDFLSVGLIINFLIFALIFFYPILITLMFVRCIILLRRHNFWR